MRTISLAAGLALACLASAPAQALPTRDLYMVKEVEIFSADYKVDPPRVLSYSGSFYVLRQHGSQIAGQMGFLHYRSDNMCLRGTVKDGKYRFVAHRGKEQPYNFRGRWSGSGSQQHVKGYTSVTRQELQKYMMGRDPKAFIDKCV